MFQVAAMLGSTADDGLVERLLLEARNQSEVMSDLLDIERTIGLERQRWHPAVGTALDDLERAVESA